VINLLVIDKNPELTNRIYTSLKYKMDNMTLDYAETREEAISQASSYALCIVLVNGDAFSPQDVEGLVQDFAIWHPGIKILVTGSQQTRNTILRYLEAGASGFLDEENSVDEMLRSLQAITRDEVVLSPNIAAALIARISQLADTKPVARIKNTNGNTSIKTKLTAREYEVLGLISGGMSNREIANELVIEIGTVKNHVHNLLQKLKLNNRYEAGRLFLEKEKIDYKDYPPPELSSREFASTSIYPEPERV
jgi:two-component system, NarL family, nitrate/nitrite response regulator NarL